MGVHRTCGEPNGIKGNTDPETSTALFRNHHVRRHTRLVDAGAEGLFGTTFSNPQPATVADAGVFTPATAVGVRGMNSPCV